MLFLTEFVVNFVMLYDFLLRLPSVLTRPRDRFEHRTEDVSLSLDGGRRLAGYQ